ncbi:MAG: arginyltransferase [Chitinivibrionales bacterium]|nr:arginyltransferase [Chitinivibrionales bacterium]
MYIIFMIYYSNPGTTLPFQCPYLPGQTARYSFFFAGDVDSRALDRLLEQGWRKFGVYFFRPQCPECRACVPVRVLVRGFKPAASQRKIRNRNTDVALKFNPLKYSDEIYEIYREHCRDRFGKRANKDEFIESFYLPSCRSFQSEYYIGTKLFAAGFLDRSARALNSIYFVFLSEERRRGPGVLSVIREIDYARSEGLDYYYLGYWIEKNSSMAYKDKYRPNEKMNWETGEWGEQ